MTHEPNRQLCVRQTSDGPRHFLAGRQVDDGAEIDTLCGTLPPGVRRRVRYSWSRLLDDPAVLTFPDGVQVRAEPWRVFYWPDDASGPPTPGLVTALLAIVLLVAGCAADTRDRIASSAPDAGQCELGGWIIPRADACASYAIESQRTADELGCVEAPPCPWTAVEIASDQWGNCLNLIVVARDCADLEAFAASCRCEL